MQPKGGQGRVSIDNSTPLRTWQSECIPILGKLAATLAILERSMLGGPAALISASDQLSAVVAESVPWLVGHRCPVGDIDVVLARLFHSVASLSVALGNEARRQAGPNLRVVSQEFETVMCLVRETWTLMCEHA
jgi:hypothetical protein